MDIKTSTIKPEYTHRILIPRDIIDRFVRIANILAILVFMALCVFLLARMAISSHKESSETFFLIGFTTVITIISVICALVLVKVYAIDINLFLYEQFSNYKFIVSEHILLKIYPNGKIQTGKWNEFVSCEYGAQGDSFQFAFQDGTNINCNSPRSTLYIIAAREAIQKTNATDKSRLQREYFSINKKLTNVLIEIRIVLAYMAIAFVFWAILSGLTLAGLIYFIENEYDQSFGITISPATMTVAAFLLIISMALYPLWYARKLGGLLSNLSARLKKILPNVKQLIPPKLMNKLM